MSSSLRTKCRITPTPSGFLHLGNAFNFITTAVFAHLEDAEILLRIDDLDQARYRREYADDIFKSLDILEIEYDLGPKNSEELEGEWSQKYRLPEYQGAIDILKEKDLIYACDCSRKEILHQSADGVYPGTCRDKNLSLKLGHTWRLRTESDAHVNFLKWREASAQVVQLPREMNEMVICRKDGVPSYQLSSVIDDLIYGISLIVRGEDLYPSSLGQLYLAKKLNLADFESVKFFHHPLLQNQEGEKMSKSVLNQPKGLIQDYTPAEIYRKYSSFIGLEEKCNSFSSLLELLKVSDLQAHSSSELGS